MDFLRFVYIVLGITFIAVGIYLLLVLHEARKNLQRSGNILDRADSLLALLEEKIIRPAASVSSYFGLIKDFFSLGASFRDILRKKSKKEKEK